MRAGTCVRGSKDSQEGACLYLEVPNGHCSIDARGAELTTIPFVPLIDRHLAEKTETQSFRKMNRGTEKWDVLVKRT